MGMKGVGLLVLVLALVMGVTRSVAAAPPRTVEGTFEPPAGFTRVPAEPGSFAAWLRAMPLAPSAAKVVDYAGRPLYDDGHHPRIAAVLDFDVGTQDLQQCADTVVRLDAEWRYATGQRDLSYRATSGTVLTYSAFRGGGRAVLEGGRLVVTKKAPPAKDEHATLRRWLDEVFAWAGTASLERDASHPAGLAGVRGGDFFVMSGRPFGHAVLVADVAKDARGRLALLLVQGFMPAQSAHVLSATDATPWFVLEPDASEVKTPFWRPFPVSALRRLASVASAAPRMGGAADPRAACLARHYGATALALPFDDGVTKTNEERLARPDLEDMLAVPYRRGPITPVVDPSHDPGRVRVEALFRAAYGGTPDAVSSALVPVELRGRRVSFHRRAADALRRVSARLDRIATPAIDRSFASLGGTFAARPIAGTDRTSAHAWGIAIDLDPSLGDYWRNESSAAAGKSAQLHWRNRVPPEVVEAFEAEGFAWGGRWYHYDTMHFEYRPELFDSDCR